jgi:hypothetical protein
MGKKVKLPKRVLGVKIPKGIRKGPLVQFLSSSGGQIVVVEALLAASALYAARRFDSSTAVGETLRHPIDGLRAGRDWSRGASDRFGRALRAGVNSFRAALSETEPGARAGEQNLDSESSASGESPERASSPKKSRSSRRDAQREEASSGPH